MCKHTVNLVLVVTQQETVGQVRHSRNQSTWVYVNVRKCYHYWHTHLDTSVSRTQEDYRRLGCDNRNTCVQTWDEGWSVWNEGVTRNFSETLYTQVTLVTQFRLTLQTVPSARLGTSDDLNKFNLIMVQQRLLFTIRVKREVKRVYRNGCRYNERLNTETGGSKTPRIHWVARINIQ